MLADHLAIIHPVKLVAAQDDEIFAAVLEKVSQVLPHGIGCALIPPCAFGSLLGGENLDEAGGEVVKLVALVDVAVERSAVELGEDIDAAQSRVQAVANRNIHQPVFAAERDGRLRAFLGEREKSGACTTAHDDGQRVGLE